MRPSGTLVGFVVLVLTLALASGALAATPEEIYRDIAENGRLDGNYSQRDLQAALQNPTAEGYGEEAVTAVLREAIRDERDVREVGVLPFTGLDLAFIAGGGMLLLAGGFALRRATRRSA